ncbi:unnamed protein product [Malus baccata var. baccata]
MAQYQARIEIKDAELFNAKDELVNSFMQFEHHGKSSHRGSITVNSTDEYCRLAESYVIKNLKCLCKAIEAIYEAIYPRKPNREDLKRLLCKADKIGFPGMIGSLYCMHWDVPGSNNDINILWSSSLFDNVVNGWAPEFRYKVNGNRYELGYYLTNGIYPSWSTFVKSFSHPNSAKKKLFSHRQESYRKDVKRAFGILQARWAIFRGPARLWQTENLHSIMMTYIILHNMILEDEYIEIEEESNEDVDDDQPIHVRVIARDVEYLAPTT